MKTSEVLGAWGKILKGQAPSLSIEITRECPLRCPGCYAYDEGHLGGEVTLRSLSDFKGQELVDRVLEIADVYKPLHLSIVGGDPLVRYREMDPILAGLASREIHVQVVTSAFRPIAAHWRDIPKLNLVVSIDGLRPEHDERRKPATYDRILKNIEGQRITVHCTVTGQMMKRPGYLREFINFWHPKAEIKRIWFSVFTPQIGDDLPEMLTTAEREQFVREMLQYRMEFPKLDMPEGLLKQFSKPPHSPDECIFAQTTETLSADLRTKVTPCQLGGNPDCSACGCIASAALAAIGDHKLGGVIPVGAIFKGSIKLGRLWGSKPVLPSREAPSQLPVLR